MTQVIEGVVKWAGNEKKYGNYSFKLEGNDDWFRNPNRNENVVQEGNAIKVKCKPSKKSGSMDVLGVALVGKATATGNTSSGGDASGGTRQESIILQHSQDAAIAVASLMVRCEAVKLAAKTKPEASKAILLDLIDELTARFYADASAPASFLAGRTEVEEEEVEEEPEAEEAEASGDDVDWE